MKFYMTDAEFFNQLLMDLPLSDFIQKYAEDEIKYGGAFQKLYGPNETPPKRYGPFGEI